MSGDTDAMSLNKSPLHLVPGNDNCWPASAHLNAKVRGEANQVMQKKTTDLVQSPKSRHRVRN